MAIRAEALESIVKAYLATIVAPQVQRRIPAARHGDEIASNLLLTYHPALALAIGGDFDIGDVESAETGVDGRDHRSGIDLDSHLAGLDGKCAFSPRPRIDNPHRDACGLQHHGRLVGVVIVGEDDAFRTGGNAIALDHAARRTCQHDAGTVVVGKGNRPFDGTGGEDHLLRPDLPQPVAWSARCQQGRVVIGNALEQHQEIMVPVADDGCAVQHMDIIGGGQGHGLRCCPFGLRLAVNTTAGDIRQSAKTRVLIGDDDLRTRGRRCFGCSEARNASTDHQHIAMHVDVLISIWIAAFRCPPQTRRAADEGFVDMLPERDRPHEGLVVEAAGQEARHRIVDGADIEFQ